MTGQLLALYIIGSKFQSSQAALFHLGFSNLILHFCNLYYGFWGLIDQYALTIMIHEALLANAPLLVLAFRFSFKGTWSHRVLLTINVCWSFVEFLFAAWADKSSITKWAARNKDLCPDLKTAFNETLEHRLWFTFVPVILGIVLAFTISFVYLWDGIRNRGRTYPRQWTFCRPMWIVWKVKEWSHQRKIICSIAACIYVFSIINLEYFIIHDFHSFMHRFSDMSSVDNGWSYGQVLAFCGGLAAFCYALRDWLIGVCTESHKFLRINFS